MIMHTEFPKWYSPDDFYALKQIFDCYTDLLQELIFFGDRQNTRFALCIPLLGHSTARSSITPSVYVVMGKDKDGKITCFRPDGKRTATFEDGTWNFLEHGWLEIKALPTAELSNRNIFPMDPCIMRSGSHTVYSSTFMVKLFDSIVIPEVELQGHLESCKLVRSSKPQYKSSFVATLPTWFKKGLKINIFKISNYKLMQVGSYKDLTDYFQI